MSSRTSLRLTSLLAPALVVAGASGALAQAPAPQAPGATATATATSMQAAPTAGDRGGQRRPSRTSIRLQGLRSGDLTAGNAVKLEGTLRPFAKGQKVTILLHRGKQTVKRKTVRVKRKGERSSLGQFEFSKRLVKPGRYSVEAIHEKNAVLGGSKAESRRFHIRYPDLGPGASGDAVKTFNHLLAELGYVNDEGSTYDSATGRAVLAFHKVNGESRTESSSSGMFKQLAKGKGGYTLKYPGAGKHIETDLSRQVMVLADDGKIQEIYTVSTGSPVTPTIVGEFHFYRKDAGYNSLGMYYSAYFQGGYATHGYASVPNYPASHGCIRNPIPDSIHIYDWIDLGDSIFIYR